MTDLRSSDREELSTAIGAGGGLNPDYDPRKAIAFWQDELMKRELECARLESENERLKGEIKAMSEMYSEMTEPLQECCQRHQLGLGGEMVHELVITELERLKETALTPEEAAHLCSMSQFVMDDKIPMEKALREKLRRISSTSEETG